MLVVLGRISEESVLIKCAGVSAVKAAAHKCICGGWPFALPHGATAAARTEVGHFVPASTQTKFLIGKAMRSRHLKDKRERDAWRFNYLGRKKQGKKSNIYFLVVEYVTLANMRESKRIHAKYK